MNPKVDDFIKNVKNWQDEFEKLRAIILDCQLQEELKWRQPCYTFQGENIAILGGFKEYCSLMFFKGLLLKDTDKLLVAPGANTQSGRQIRFANIQEIIENEAIIKAYLFEAIEVEKSGLKVELKKASEYQVPDELQIELDKNSKLKSAFEALTPGRQKGYLLYFSGAKQSKTRQSRIENYKQRILDGKGFHDCVCGMSKKMPSCDGSHKYI